MYNLANNKRRNLITSCSCSHFAMYRYYWYLFFLVFIESAFLHSYLSILFLFLSSSPFLFLFHATYTSMHTYARTRTHTCTYSLLHQPIAINSVFRTWSIKKRGSQRNRTNEPTSYRHLVSGTATSVRPLQRTIIVMI